MYKLWQVSLIIAVFAIGASAPARAGGGPLNVLLVINKNSSESIEVGRYYQKIRHIPERNVLHVETETCGRIAYTKFQTQILNPILSYIDSEGLSEQIDFIVYSAGFPYSVISPASDLYYGKTSLTTATYWQGTYDQSNLSLHGPYNSYYAVGSNPGALSNDQFYCSSDPSKPYYGKYISFMLGYIGADETVGRIMGPGVYEDDRRVGNTVAEMKSYLDKGLESDGSWHTHTIYFVERSTDPRNCRYPYYQPTANALNVMLGDGAAEVLADDSPDQTRGNVYDKTEVAGSMCGVALLDASNQNTYLPGAYCDHLTSHAAHFDDRGQTKASQWLRYGATISSGSVIEPYAWTQKFPRPEIYVLQAAGYSAIEACWMSIKAPWAMLFLGDPLSKPWATLPTVTINGIDDEEEITGNVNTAITATTNSSNGLDRLQVYVDGVLQQTWICDPPQPNISESFLLTYPTTDTDEHLLQAVAYEAGKVRTQGVRTIRYTTRGVPTPVLIPDSHVFYSPDEVTVKCDEDTDDCEGTVIHYTYTTDGTEPPDPTENDPTIQSGSTYAVSVSQILKLKAFNGTESSYVKRAEYKVTSKVADPTCNVAPGVFDSAPVVRLTCSTPDSTLSFTTNRNQVTAGDWVYSIPQPGDPPTTRYVKLETTSQLKAKAYRLCWEPSEAVDFGEYWIRNRVYVNKYATGAEDGKYWDTAFRNVQDAIDACVAPGQVWVAGRDTNYYNPESGAYVGNVTLKEGVKLYGGFAGTDTNWTSRNPARYVTILDGGNSGSVVSALAGVTTATLIDGFTIRNGNGTDVSGVRYGGGIYCDHGSPTISGNKITGNSVTGKGSGIYLLDASPTISGNTINLNNATVDGGGIYCDGGSPTVSGNTINLNTATVDGGGIFCGGESSPQITGNTITQNTAQGAGAGLYCGNTSAPTISGNNISSNTATNGGGGIYTTCSISGYPVISSNDIYQNTAASGGGIHSVAGSSTPVCDNHIYSNTAASGGGVYLSAGSASVSRNSIYSNTASMSGGGIWSSSASLTIVGNKVADNSAMGAGGLYIMHGSASINCNVISGNVATELEGGGLFLIGAETALINNTIVGNSSHDLGGGGIWTYQGSAAICNNIIAYNTYCGLTVAGNTNVIALRNNNAYGNTVYDWSPNQAGMDGNISADPKFMNMENGDFHISSDSPCLDTGSNIDAPSSPDIDGQARVMPTNGAVDIGADEFVIIFVKSTGSDSNDGLSWDTAKRTVSAAVSGPAPMEVWVAAVPGMGSYTENIVLKDGVALYGGFAGTEATRQDRDPNANVTILDGDRNGSVVSIGPGATLRTVVDGFTIQHGSSGGVYCVGSATISHNVIIDNETDGFGGGICCFQSPEGVVISDNIIARNAASEGGGLLIGSSSKVVNNTIAYNTGDYDAGAIEFCGATAVVANNIIAFNSSGIWETGGSTFTWRNNDVYGNTAYNFMSMTDPAGTDGNISADPLFVSATDYHLQYGSPCREAGDNSCVLSEYDLDKQTRIQGVVEMGVDEYEELPGVSNFLAVSGDEQASLSWQNPTDSGFAGTIVRYRIDSYPTTPTDGLLVCDKTNSPGSTDSYVHTGLTNGVTYYYSAFAYNALPSYSDAATADAIPADVTPPGHVTNFAAASGSNQSSLSWTNPTDDDFAGVKILFKTEGWPQSPTDGTVIYDGTGTSYNHTGLTDGVACYYMAYSYDTVPNYASGTSSSTTPGCFFEDLGSYPPGASLAGQGEWTGYDPGFLPKICILPWGSGFGNSVVIQGGEGMRDAFRPVVTCAAPQDGIIWVSFDMNPEPGGYTTWNLWIDDIQNRNLARFYGRNSSIRGRVGPYHIATNEIMLNYTWSHISARIDTVNDTTEYFVNGQSIGVLDFTIISPGDAVGRVRFERISNPQALGETVWLDNVCIWSQPAP